MVFLARCTSAHNTDSTIMFFVFVCSIYRLLPDSCQKVLFSATYSDEVMEFAHKVVPNPAIIRLQRNEESLDNIKQVIVVLHSYYCSFLPCRGADLCTLVLWFPVEHCLALCLEKGSTDHMHIM